MTITLPPEGIAMLETAIERQACEIASAKLYAAQEAIATFGITRAAIKHLPRTMPPGRTKPLYSARSIRAYLATRETPPETKPRTRKP